MSMRNNLPKVYRTAEMIVDMDVAAEIGEIDATEFSDQIFIDSMTWQLPVEEKIAGLVMGRDDLETRRKNLRMKWHSQFVKGDLESIRTVLEAYCRGEMLVAYEYPVVTVSFTRTIGVPLDLHILKMALRKIIPAHLRVDYVYVFLKHEQAGDYTQIHLSGYTHQEIRNGDILRPEYSVVIPTNGQIGAHTHQQLSIYTQRQMRVHRERDEI